MCYSYASTIILYFNFIGVVVYFTLIIFNYLEFTVSVFLFFFEYFHHNFYAYIFYLVLKRRFFELRVYRKSLAYPLYKNMNNDVYVYLIFFNF